MNKKIILYTKYDLRDFDVIKFNELYEFENEYIKGSLKSFPTKEDAENYFRWNGINIVIKEGFWEEMGKIKIWGNSNSYLKLDTSSDITIRGHINNLTTGGIKC